MYALEAEPEKSGRWRRLGAGAVIAALIGGGVIFAAHTVAPNSKLFKSVMKIAIVDYEPPKPKPRAEETPPPPKPLPPKPKPKEQAPAEKSATPPPPQQQAQNPGEPHQRRCADKLKARWHVIDAGQYPMLSTPDELARLIVSG